MREFLTNDEIEQFKESLYNFEQRLCEHEQALRDSDSHIPNDLKNKLNHAFHAIKILAEI